MDSKLEIVDPTKAMRAGLEETMRLQKENSLMDFKLKNFTAMVERKD